MSFDRSCYDLAIVFLEDEPGLAPLADDLAQTIQDAVEAWFDDKKRRADD